MRGLPEKLKKDALRRELYLLFSTYGPVLDIVTLKTMKMRGQAHIVFRDIQSATMAMRACADMDFHGKNLVRINCHSVHTSAHDLLANRQFSTAEVKAKRLPSSMVPSSSLLLISRPLLHPPKNRRK